jgi:hypothetical protein
MSMLDVAGSAGQYALRSISMLVRAYPTSTVSSKVLLALANVPATPPLLGTKLLCSFFSPQL